MDKMSESMASSPPIEPVDKSGNDRSRRWRFQFSLRSLLLFILIVALVVTSLLMYRRMSDAEQELVKLRNVAGYLKIDDENRFYAIAIETDEPWTWLWRVYLPAGYKYSWHMNYGNIPANDTSDNSGGSASDGAPRIKGTEATVYLSLRKDPENKWLLNLTCLSSDGKNNLSITVSDDVMNQILNAKMTEGENIGEGKAVSYKIDKPIIFLKRRIGEKQPNGSWQSSQKPMPGIIIWLEAVK
jgi:hypothetical protein